MTTWEQIGVLIILLAIGGFSGWAIYCGQRARRTAEQRYYRSEEWRRNEAESLAELGAGKSQTFSDPWDAIQYLGEYWTWPTTSPSQEIYDQFNPRPWARRDR